MKELPCLICGERVRVLEGRTAPVWCIDCLNGKDKPPLETLPTGATASKLDVAWDELDMPALRRAAQAMHNGIATHGKGNWRKGIDKSTCLNHLYEHLAQYQSGNTDEDHLAHAMCRLMMLMVQHG